MSKDKTVKAKPFVGDVVKEVYFWNEQISKKFDKSLRHDFKITSETWGRFGFDRVIDCIGLRV